MAPEARIQTVGRRKRSVARVLLSRGSGKWSVNGRELSDYFPRPTHQIRISEPLKVTGSEGLFDVTVMFSQEANPSAVSSLVPLSPAT